MLVAFEGIDGSGKTTVIRKIAEALREEGLKVTTTQEPTKTWLGDAVRQGIRSGLDPLAMAFLFLADRAAHVRDLEAKRAEGAVILTDRYVDSTSAYQAAALEARIPDALDYFTKLQDSFFPRPDLALLLDCAPEVALQRIGGRKIKEPFEQVAFLKRVRSNYLKLAKSNRLLVVDATPDADVVAEKLLPMVLERVRRAASVK